MFKIVLTARALRDLNKMEKETRRRIVIKLKGFAREPFINARKLINPKIGTWRLRIDKYRVIFDIENDTIVVLRVGHRRDIYR